MKHLVNLHDPCTADPTFKENLVTTVEDLLGMNVVPVFNENDAISKGVVKCTVGYRHRTFVGTSSCSSVFSG